MRISSTLTYFYKIKCAVIIYGVLKYTLLVYKIITSKCMTIQNWTIIVVLKYHMNIHDSESILNSTLNEKLIGYISANQRCFHHPMVNFYDIPRPGHSFTTSMREWCGIYNSATFVISVM